MSEHPSFLELDTYALQRTGAPELVRHTEACEQCAAHLATLRQPMAVPDWVHALPPARRRFALPSWLLPLGAVALAVGLLLVVVPQEAAVPTEPPAWTAKGTPEVRIIVKRGAQTFTWSEDARLAKGDGLRVELHPSGYAHYALVSPGGGSYAVLAKGELRGDPELVPGAWEVDGSAEDERLVIVLSRDPLTSAQLDEAVATLPRSAEVWTLTRRLRKQETP